MTDDDYTWEHLARRALAATGHFRPTADEVEHMTVLLQAFQIYQQREKIYKGLWKESGSADNAQMVGSKAQRMRVTEGEAAADTALDAVNFSVFFFLNKQAGR